MKRILALAAFAAVLWVSPAGQPVHAASRALTGLSSSNSVALSIEKSGLYRISGSWLAAHGITWEGVSGSSVAITFRGKPVARLVSTNGPLTQASSVEFYAAGVSTQYTGAAVYYLSADKANALAPTELTSAPGAGAADTTYTTQYQEDRLTYYDPLPPGPNWFYTSLVANAGPAHVDDHVSLANVVRGGKASIWFQVWGATDLGGPGPQHIVIVKVNGHRVTRMQFSGSIFQAQSAEFSANWLKSGKNTITFADPGTVKNQYDLDEMDIATLMLTYRRKLTAVSSMLTANLPAGKHVTATGFGSAPTIWFVGDGVPSVVSGAVITGKNGAFSVSLSTTQSGTYVMAGSRHLMKPAAVELQGETSYLLSGSAKLLIISPRGFSAALKPLVAYHDAHGMPTKLADLNDVYSRFSSGIVDPLGIQAYIRQAAQALGVVDVLLVGADTFDYHHYTDCSHGACPANPKDVSLLPSLYTRDDFYGQIPSDELYVDNGQGPTLGIGRIPAVTVGEVKTVVKKTLALLKHPKSNPSAVMASGSEDPAFQSTSDALASLLPSRFAVSRAYEGTLGNSAARKVLMKHINAGSTIVNFVGHGNLEQWGNEPALLTVDDVPHLRSSAKPAFFFGWGCQTAYDVDPTDRALNARLLMDTEAGAVLTVGSTGLDLAQPQAQLAEQFYTRLFQNAGTTTIGQALQAAEDAALQADPSTIQPVQSYEIFGDPALPIRVMS